MKISDDQEALINAIYDVDLAAVEKLLKKKVDPNFTHERATPLHVTGIMIWNTRSGPRDGKQTAAARKSGELLIAAGAEIDFAAAAMLGRKDLVEAALAKDPKLARARFKPNDHTIEEMAGWCGAFEISSLLRATAKAGKLPPNEWKQWADKITVAVDAALKKFKDTATKLVLDVDSGNGTMFLAIDTTSTKKWLPGEFSHSQFAGLHDVKVLKPLVDKFEQVETEAESKQLTESFLAAAVAGLKAANLELVKRARGFEAIVMDHDEPIAAARKRMG